MRAFLPPACLLRISLAWAMSSLRRFWVGVSESFLGRARSILALMALWQGLVRWLIVLYGAQ